MTVDSVLRDNEDSISSLSKSSEVKDSQHIGNHQQKSQQDNHDQSVAMDTEGSNTPVAQNNGETPMEVCHSSSQSMSAKVDSTKPKPVSTSNASTSVNPQTDDPMISCLKRQRDAVKKCRGSSLVLGQEWYVLSMAWFSRWQQYVGYRKYEEKYLGKEAYFPGCIDNSDILDVNGDLKPKLMNEHDYMLLRGDAWTMLVEYYELAPGQEPITRSVICRGSERKILEIEVYQLTIEIGLLDNENGLGTVSCQFSKSATFGDVAERAREALSLTERQKSSDLRLWLSSGGYSAGLVEPILKLPDDYLDGYVKSNDLILMELPNLEDGIFSRPFEEFRISGPQLPDQTPAPQSGAAIPLGPPAPPSIASTSNTSTSWQSHSTPTTPGLCGLVNMGNTCFMSSTLQCLSNVPILTEYMLSDKWRSELNCTNPLGMRGEIAKAYAALIANLWSGKFSYLAPRDFKATLSEFAPQFSGFQQHDGQEVMAFMLDGLHEDLNRIISKPYIEIKEADNRPDAVVAEEAWQNYMLRNDSIIVDLFHGQLKSTLICPECEKVSVTFDPFCYLSLPLPQDQHCFTFHFVRLDPNLPPVKCKLTLPPDGTMALAYQGLSEMFQLPKNRILIGEVYYHKFHRFLVANDTYSHISDRGQFYAFELREPFETESNTSPIRFKYVYFLDEALASRASYAATMYFGTPMLLELDMDKAAPPPEDNDNATESGAVALPVVNDGSVLQSAVRSAIAERCSRFLDNPSKRLAEPDTYKNWWHQDAPDRQVEPPPYTLYASRSGTFVRDTAMLMDPDEVGAVLPSEYSYIWVSLNSLNKRLFYDDAAAKTEEIHPSASDSLEAEKCVSLDDCLKLYTDTETLGKKDAWHCPNCKRFQCATKKIDLWSLPPVLVCHLKRFSYERHYRSKIDTKVDYPVENLDLRQWIIQPDYGQSTKYNLLAVAHHFGGLGAGHYTATAFHKPSNAWYYYDDCNVHKCVTRDELVAKSAYVLVYIRSDLSSNLLQLADDATAAASLAVESSMATIDNESICNDHNDVADNEANDDNDQITSPASLRPIGVGLFGFSPFAACALRQICLNNHSISKVNNNINNNTNNNQRRRPFRLVGCWTSDESERAALEGFLKRECILPQSSLLLSSSSSSSSDGTGIEHQLDEDNFTVVVGGDPAALASRTEVSLLLLCCRGERVQIGLAKLAKETGSLAVRLWPPPPPPYRVLDTVAVGCSYRYLPSVQCMRSRLSTGLIGQLQVININLRYPKLIGERYDWTCDPDMGGGVLAYYGAIAVELVHYLAPAAAAASLAVRAPLTSYEVISASEPHTLHSDPITESEQGILQTIAHSADMPMKQFASPELIKSATGLIDSIARNDTVVVDYPSGSYWTWLQQTLAAIRCSSQLNRWVSIAECRLGPGSDKDGIACSKFPT
uniref:ubiquitinyl hydrolase 1 n=1 Tax=Macrostomum lignano TaxID=282301 RepID=A0A1I8JJ24_9PLAT